MATWTGWQADLLGRAGFATTDGNLHFMSAWGSHSKTDCSSNPVMISWPLGRSKNCEPLGIRSLQIQAYTSQAQGASAFDQQLRQDNYSHLISALQGGDPYNLPNDAAKQVYNDLIRWGTPEAANAYAVATYASQVPGLKTPKAHEGWKALQVSINQHMPQELDASRRTTDAALRTLQKARKVRL